MLPAYEKKSNTGVILAISLALLTGLLCYFAGANESNALGSVLGMIALIVALVAAVFWCWGLGCYLIGKGYSGVLAVIGLLGLLGLIIVLILPDKNKVLPQAVTQTEVPTL